MGEGSGEGEGGGEWGRGVGEGSGGGEWGRGMGEGSGSPCQDSDICIFSYYQHVMNSPCDLIIARL